jgi:hypothetical protein
MHTLTATEKKQLAAWLRQIDQTDAAPTPLPNGAN